MHHFDSYFLAHSLISTIFWFSLIIKYVQAKGGAVGAAAAAGGAQGILFITLDF